MPLTSLRTRSAPTVNRADSGCVFRKGCSFQSYFRSFEKSTSWSYSTLTFCAKAEGPSRSPTARIRVEAMSRFTLDWRPRGARRGGLFVETSRKPCLIEECGDRGVSEISEAETRVVEHSQLQIRGNDADDGPVDDG